MDAAGHFTLPVSPVPAETFPLPTAADSLPDITPEAAFDRITILAGLTFNAPIALVNLVRGDKLFFKSCFGLELQEAGLDSSFCTYAIQSSQVIVVPDATKDPRFRDNPMVTGYPHIRFYAGAPLKTPEGVSIGTLRSASSTQSRARSSHRGRRRCFTNSRAWSLSFSSPAAWSAPWPKRAPSP